MSRSFRRFESHLIFFVRKLGLESCSPMQQHAVSHTWQRPTLYAPYNMTAVGKTKCPASYPNTFSAVEAAFKKGESQLTYETVIYVTDFDP